VIKRGTGRRALTLGRNDLAGKTGTTNGPMDAWFSGYNRDVVTTAWVGFDNYTPLGRREFGGTAALPIWIDYMRGALRDSPDVQPPLPPGVVHVRIDPDTGLLARPGQQNAIFEYFREDQVPAASGGTGDSGLRGTTEDLVRDIF
jgi:penicillin-binding protein 1A